MIEIKRIKIRNFKSFGDNYNEYEFDNSGMYLVVGENMDSPDVSNGSGKSTLLDSIVYSLYGKSIDGLKDNDLINNINGKNMEVSIVFRKDDKFYKVYRGRKVRDGNVVLLYENDEEAFTDDHEITRDSMSNTNEAIIRILGISYELFIRVACFSANHTPFFELSARSGSSNQSSIIEELFELLELAENAEVLKDSLRENEAELKLETTKHDQRGKEAKRLEDQKVTAASRIDAWETKRKDSLSKLTEINDTIKDFDFDVELETHETLRTQNDMSIRINSAVEILEKDIKVALRDRKTLNEEHTSLSDNICPYCHQPHTDDTKIVEIEQKLAEICRDVDSYKGKLATLVTEKDRVNSEIEALESKLTYDKYETVTSLAEKKRTIQSKIDELLNETNPHIETLEELEQIDIGELGYDTINKISNLIDHQKFLYKLLTNKNSFIRKNLLNKHIPYLNSRLYYYLNEMELPHLVEFGHDLSAKISKFGNKLEFGNLSNGQKARVNLALSLAFRDILEKLYGKISLCMLDEVLDYGLDSIGVELAVKILKNKATNENTAIYVISHRNELDTLFDNKVRIVMENNFSNIRDD